MIRVSTWLLGDIRGNTLQNFPVTDYSGCPTAHARSEQAHTCPEGQAGVAAVDAAQGLAHQLRDAADLRLDVCEGDFGEGVAVLVDKHGTCTRTRTTE